MLKLILSTVLDAGRVVEVSIDDFLTSQKERRERGIETRWVRTAPNHSSLHTYMSTSRRRTARHAARHTPPHPETNYVCLAQVGHQLDEYRLRAPSLAAQAFRRPLTRRAPRLLQGRCRSRRRCMWCVLLCDTVWAGWGVSCTPFAPSTLPALLPPCPPTSASSALSFTHPHIT